MQTVSVIFDSSNPNYNVTPEYNLVFLRATQRRLNEVLLSEGSLFLNDVFKTLGVPTTRLGQTHGWITDEDGYGDVDFGIWDLERGEVVLLDYLAGKTNEITLTFNVQDILNKVWKD